MNGEVPNVAERDVGATAGIHRHYVAEDTREFMIENDYHDVLTGRTVIGYGIAEFDFEMGQPEVASPKSSVAIDADV